MTDGTDPKSLRADIEECKLENAATRKLFDQMNKNVLDAIHNSKFAEELNRLDTRLNIIESKQKKIFEIGQFLLQNKEFFTDIEKTYHEMKIQISKNTKKADDLHKKKKETDEKITQIDNQINNHTQHLSDIDTRLDLLKPEIMQDAKNETIQLIKAEVKKLKKKIDSEHQELLKNLDEKTQAQLNDLGEEIQKVNDQSNTLIGQLRNDHENAVKRIEDAKNEAIAQAAENVLDIRQKQSDDSNRIDQLFENINEINDSINKLNEKADSIALDVKNNKAESDQEDQTIHDEINAFKQLFNDQNESDQKDFISIRNEIENLKNEDKRIEEKFDDEVNNLNNQIRELDEKTSKNLHQQASRLDERINKTNKEFSDFVSLANPKFNEIDQEIDEIHGTETQMQKNHDDLSDSLNKIIANKENSLDEKIKTVNDLLTDFQIKSTEEMRKCKQRNEEVYQIMMFIQGNENMSMTDLMQVLQNTKDKVEEASEQLKKGLDQAREKMIKDIQIANELTNKNVGSLQNQLDNQRESIKQVLSEQIQEANQQFHQIMNDMNVDTLQTRQLLCQFFDIDSKILTLALSQNNNDNNSDIDKKNLAFQVNLPTLIQMINEIDERSQNSSKRLNEELNDFSKGIEEELETYENMKIDIEKRNNDLDQFKQIMSSKVDELKATTEEVRIIGENFNKNISSFQSQIEQANNKIDRSNEETKNEIDAINNQIELVENSIKSSFKSKFETFINNYNESLQDLEQKSSDLNNRLDGMFGSSGLTFDKFIEEVQSLHDESTRVLNSEENTNNKIRQIQTELEAFAQNSAERNDQAMDEINKIKENFQSTIDDNSKLINDQLKNTKKELQKLIQSVDNKVLDGESPIKAASLIERINQIEEDSKNGDILLSNRINQLLESVNNNFSTLTNTCHKLNKNVEIRKSEIENLQQQTQNRLDELKVYLVGENEQINNQIKSNHDETLHRFNEVTNSFADVRKLIDDISNESHNLVDELEIKSNNLLIKSQEDLQNALEVSFKSVNDNFVEIRKLINMIQGKDGNDIPSLVKRISTIEENFQSQIKGIQEHNSQINQDLSTIVNNNKISVDERFEKILLDYNAKVENAIKTAENQSSQNLQRIEKLNTNINSKLHQLDEKIINLDGDSGINLKSLYDAFNELNLSVHAEFTKAANEINKMKRKQERQPGLIKDELTNEFKSLININKTDNDIISSRMNEIIEKQKEYATIKLLQEVDKRISTLEETQINELIKSNEKIKTDINEYNTKFSTEVTNKLTKHHKLLNALKESVTRINGDAEESLGQALEKISHIEKDLLIEKNHIADIQNSTTEEIRKAEDHFIIETGSLNAQFEEMRQQISTENKKIIEDVNENARVIKEHFIQTEADMKTLEGNTKNQMLQHEQQLADRYSAFTAQISNKISKAENDLSIAKSSLEKVNNHQIAFTRSTKDSLESLRTDIDSRFELSAKAIQNLHIEVSNEIAKLLSDNSIVLTNLTKEVDDKATESISKLRADFEKLRCGSLLSIPMIVDQITAVSEFVNSKEKEYDTKINGFDDKINNVEQNSLDKTKQKSNKLKSFIKLLQEQTDNNKKQLDEAILKIQGELRDEIKNMDKRITSTINGNKDNVDASIKQIIEDQKSSQAKTDNQFSTIDVQFNGIDERFKAFQEEEKNHFSEFFRKTSEKVNDKNGKNLEQVNKSILKIKIEVQQKIDEMIDLANKLQSAIKEAQSNTDQISIQNKEIIATVKNEMNDYLSQFKESVQTKLNHMKKRIQSANDTIDEIKSENKISLETVDSKIETTNNKLSELKNSVSNQMKSALEEVDHAIEKVNNEFSVLNQNNDNQFKKFKNDYEIALENAKVELIKDTTQRNNAIRSEFVTIRTDLRSKTEGIEKDIHDLQEDLKTTVRPNIKKINVRVEELSLQFGVFNQETSNKFADIDEKFKDSSKFVSNVEKFIERSENKMNEFTKNLKLDFIAARKEIDTISNKATHDISEMKASVDAIKRDILDLKRIKHFNAQFEEFNMRFEDALSGLRQFQRTIFNYVLPAHQNMVAVNGQPFNNSNKSTSPDKKIQKLMKKEPLVPSQKEKFFIKGKKKDGTNNENELNIIEKDTEIGEIIRDALKTHNYVVLVVPEKRKVYWNKSVSLLPNQTLEIQGERMSSIQMDGISQVGDMSDISRVIIDGFGYFKIKNIKVQAQCNLPLPLFSSLTKANKNDKYLTCLDLGALFVSRCWDASGPGTIIIDSCSFETDVPLVNVGANSFCHVKICDSGLTTRALNSNNSESNSNLNINPITCDNGGYSQGYGTVSIRNVNISSPRIKWLTSPYLIQPDLSNE